MIIPDEIYDDWLPRLGAMVIGVYGAILRLDECQSSVKVGDLETICLVHGQTLTLICRKLFVCGLVELNDPIAQRETIITLLPLPLVATRGTPVLFGSARLCMQRPSDRELQELERLLGNAIEAESGSSNAHALLIAAVGALGYMVTNTARAIEVAERILYDPPRESWYVDARNTRNLPESRSRTIK